MGPELIGDNLFPSNGRWSQASLLMLRLHLVGVVVVFALSGMCSQADNFCYS